MLQAWCERVGITWGSGIGGGMMLQVLGIVYPILTGIILLQMTLSFFSAGTIPGKLWISLVMQIFIWFFQQRRVVLYGPFFVSGSQRASVGRPIYEGHDTLFSIYPRRRYIYDFVLSFKAAFSSHF